MLPNFNCNSPQQISVLLFGGTILVDEVINDGLYKNGKVKYKKVKVEKQIQGLGVPVPKGVKKGKTGYYSTAEDVLARIKHPLAKKLLSIRALNKQVETYYTAVEELVYEEDSCVHAQFQHVMTGTGRLSCKAPNTQNVPVGYSNIKKHFVSRYPNGVIVSGDYSQLEIRIQAQVSQDPAYMQDVIAGVDFHVKRLAMKLRADYTVLMERLEAGDKEVKEARSIVKGFSFARAYGAGVKKLMEQTGMTREEIELLIENEAIAYPRLTMFNEYNQQTVEAQGYYTDPWNCRYDFVKYPAKYEWQSGDSYSPNEILNYKIQGFATGVIVLAMIGKFWREKALHNRHKYLMINTVHDSLMLDSKGEYLEDAKEDLMILEQVAEVSKEKFNYEFNVPIKLDVSCGESWHDC